MLCPKCGNELKPASRFCAYCGTTLGEKPSADGADAGEDFSAPTALSAGAAASSAASSANMPGSAPEALRERVPDGHDPLDDDELFTAAELAEESPVPARPEFLTPMPVRPAAVPASLAPPGSRAPSGSPVPYLPPERPPAAPPPAAHEPEAPPPSGRRLRPSVLVPLLLIVLLLAGGIVGVIVIVRSSGPSSVAGDVEDEGTAADDVTGVDREDTSGDSADETSGGTGNPAAVDISDEAVLTASSVLAPDAVGVDYLPDNLVDGDLESCWAEGSSGYGIGDWVKFTLPEEYEVTRISVVPGLLKMSGSKDRWLQNGRLKKVRFVFDGNLSYEHSFQDVKQSQDFTLPTAATTRTVTMIILEVYPGQSGPGWTAASDTSVSEMHVFGL
ncbi:MAG: zinc ribbon domain-containing protein [Candidatus Geothermincolia bacterium]